MATNGLPIPEVPVAQNHTLVRESIRDQLSLFRQEIEESITSPADARARLRTLELQKDMMVSFPILCDTSEVLPQPSYPPRQALQLILNCSRLVRRS